MDPVDQDDATTALRLECLADRRRRLVLAAVREESASLSLDQLARLVAARETAQTVGSIQPAFVKEVQLTLWHIHLPKLEAAGLIEFDRDTKIVGPRQGHRGKADWPDTQQLQLEVVLDDETAVPPVGGLGESSD